MRRKLFLSMLLIAMPVGVLTGCGSDVEEVASDVMGAETAEAKTTEKSTVASDGDTEVDSEALTDYAGNWIYDDASCYLIINDDASWLLEDASGNILGNGSAKVDNGQLSLSSKYDDTNVVTISKEGDQLKDNEGSLLSHVDAAPDQLGFPLQDFYGSWLSDYSDGSKLYINVEESPSRMTVASMDNGGLTSFFQADYEYKNGKVVFGDENAKTDNESKREVSLYEDGTLHFALFPSSTFEKVDDIEDDGFITPTPFDEMTETFEPAGNPDIKIHYPSTMTIETTTDYNLFLRPKSVREVEDFKQDDAHSLLMVTAGKWNEDEKKYLNMGELVAEKYIQKFANDLIVNVFKDNVVSAKATDFINTGKYYEMQVYCDLKPGYAFDDGYDANGFLVLRYVDNEYVFISTGMVAENNIQEYRAVADSIFDSIEYEHNDWTTASAEVPDTEAAFAAYQELSGSATAADTGSSQKASSTASNTKSNTHVSAKLINNKGASSKKGTGGVVAPFFWTDGGGNIWYWNGSDNVFYGEEGDFYTDGGAIYESNDAGWDDDLVGTYYYYDYEPYSDPGDTQDDWSDPGDTQDYWSDPGDMSDPGDTEDYYDYTDYSEDYTDYSEDYTDYSEDYTDYSEDYTDYSEDYSDYSEDYSYDDYSYDDYSYDDYGEDW